MAKTKQEVYQYCSKYIDYTEEKKNAFGITNYHAFDMKKVNANRKEIVGFFKDNFDFMYPTISYEDLLFDEDGNQWIYLKAMQDLAILDLLVAFGQAAGIFIFDLQVLLNLSYHKLIRSDERIPFISYNYSPYLSPENMDLDSKEKVDAYLKTLLFVVFPQGEVTVDERFYKLREEKEKELAMKRELLHYFYEEYCPDYLKSEIEEKFNSLVNEKPKSLYSLFLYYFTLGVDAIDLFRKVRSGLIHVEIQNYLTKELSPDFLKECAEIERELIEAYQRKQKQKRL